MRRLHDTCTSKQLKDWIQFPHGMHNDTCMQPGYFQAIAEYLKTRVLPRKDEILKLQEQSEKAQAEAEALSGKKKKKYLAQGRRKSAHW